MEARVPYAVDVRGLASPKAASMMVTALRAFPTAVSHSSSPACHRTRTWDVCNVIARGPFSPSLCHIDNRLLQAVPAMANAPVLFNACRGM